MPQPTLTEVARGHYRVINPATGEVLRTVPPATDAEASAAVAAAHSAFGPWRDLGLAERSEVVRRAADLFDERAEELGRIITTEMGKPLPEAVGEVRFSADILRYYADHGAELAADRPLPTPAGSAVVQTLPIGALLGVMPWNYPYYQVARFAAPNLVLGNTIVLKHALNCPDSAAAIQGIMDDAGVPAGVYTTVSATHAQIEAIIADGRIRGVSLTGSERAGAIVAEQAGRHLKKVALELGGSDPYIVLDADDVPAAAAAAWRTRMGNTGQACNSNKRIIVADAIHDAFVAELAALARGLVPGDPAVAAPGTFAPMATRAGAEEIAEQVRDAVERGATLHAGGELHAGPGAYFSPAVLTGVVPGMRAYSEELFGPVAVVYRAADAEEALALANDTAFGLGGAVFSGDAAAAVAVAERLDVGMSNVNAHMAPGADMPFGGTKRSGFGRELGPFGMDEFANKRLLYVAG